ncbi:MAG: DUF3108 domain-containing protein [Magnetovibrio sp.]|nr:DUF3108 domain-containing protein [Magnetovibrio sp.]
MRFVNLIYIKLYARLFHVSQDILDVILNFSILKQFHLPIWFLVFGLSLPFPAHAKELYLRYEAYWGGLHIADFALSLINTPNTFEHRFHLESRGLTRFFSNLAAKAVSRGKIIQPPVQSVAGSRQNGHLKNAAADLTLANLNRAKTYVAETYRTEYTNKRHFRWVNIDFGTPTQPAKAVTGTKPIPGREDRWNPKEKGPEVLDRVEARFRTSVNDPITLVPQLMEIVRTHLNGGPKSGLAKGFDGRRRFDMNITYLGPVRRTIAGIRQDTYRVRLIPNPVAGFKNRHKMLWNNAAYDFYLARDGSFAPLANRSGGSRTRVDHGGTVQPRMCCESRRRLSEDPILGSNIRA